MPGGSSVEPATPPRQLIVVAECESAALRMRLLPLAPAGERVAVAKGDVGIVPIEEIGAQEPLKAVFHIFRELEWDGAAGDAPLDRAFSALQEALALEGISLRCEREALYGAPLPALDRSGNRRGISLRPSDIELTAIDAGLRRVVKLDRLPARFVDKLSRIAGDRGLLAETVAPDDRDDDVTLLVARDSTHLDRAVDLERRLLVPGSAQTRDDASARMGELLGYPPCCTERFARVTEHNDTNLAWALLPGLAAPASPLTQWLQPSLALLSHSPCGLECRPSIDLGRRLLDAVEANDPGFARRWRSLTSRIQVVDRYGNRIALAAEGSLEGSVKIEAADLLADGGPDPDAADRAESLIGSVITADSGGVVAPGSDWYAPYAADHRGSI